MANFNELLSNYSVRNSNTDTPGHTSNIAYCISEEQKKPICFEIITYPNNGIYNNDIYISAFETDLTSRYPDANDGLELFEKMKANNFDFNTLSSRGCITVAYCDGKPTIKHLGTILKSDIDIKKHLVNMVQDIATFRGDKELSVRKSVIGELKTSQDNSAFYKIKNMINSKIAHDNSKPPINNYQLLQDMGFEESSYTGNPDENIYPMHITPKATGTLQPAVLETLTGKYPDGTNVENRVPAFQVLYRTISPNGREFYGDLYGNDFSL